MRGNGKVQLSLAIGLSIGGIGLLTAGFIAPPLGQISSSVLVAFGEVMTFVGALMGIDYRYRYRE